MKTTKSSSAVGGAVFVAGAHLDVDEARRLEHQHELVREVAASSRSCAAPRRRAPRPCHWKARISMRRRAAPAGRPRRPGSGARARCRPPSAAARLCRATARGSASRSSFRQYFQRHVCAYGTSLSTTSVPPGSRWSYRRRRPSTSCSRRPPSPNAAADDDRPVAARQVELVHRLRVEVRRRQPLALAPLTDALEHVGRDVGAVDVEPGLEIRHQQPPRAARRRRAPAGRPRRTAGTTRSPGRRD